MGTPQFSVPLLEALINSRHNVVAVVTNVDKPAGRKRKLLASAVKQAAIKHNLPILQPEKLDDSEFLAEVAALKADAGVVVAFRILPVELYSIPKLGCINLHTSLLPDLRGAAPINWALMRGYTQTGVTTFQIEKKVDKGQILLQEPIAIKPDDDYGSLSLRMAQVGTKLMVETLDRLEAGNITSIKQDGKGSRAPKITPETCRIDWSNSAEDLHNQVRGLSPAPAARTHWGGKVLKLFKTQIVDAKSSARPSVVIGLEDEVLLVQTGDGVLGILELQLEGKKRMNIIDFFRGKPIPSGTLLG